MYTKMKTDKEQQTQLLTSVLKEAETFFNRRDSGTVSPVFPEKRTLSIEEDGMGAQGALDYFLKHYAPYVNLNTGPKFYGYIIGGVTPAALAGDWLTSLYDQNAFGMAGHMDRQVEEEAVTALIDLLDLNPEMTGSFTSGATMATVNALAVAREWAGQKQGKTADDGIYGLKRPVVLSGTAHPSVYKGLSILGFGRNSVISVGTLPGREAVCIESLKRALAEHADEPCIVLANMGTANSGDVDDLEAIAALKKQHDFFLHLDGAIGIVASASPKYRPLFKGVHEADSLTIDCHKWLNIPYDSAIALINKKHRNCQYRVYAQTVSVRDSVPDETEYTNMGNEGSRRFRAIPVWMSLMAYGKKGYAHMVEQDCDMARLFAKQLEDSGAIRLISRPVLNGFAFTLDTDLPSVEDVEKLKQYIRLDGHTFLNSAFIIDTPVLRCSLSNWGIGEEHVRDVAASVIRCAQKVLSEKQ